MSNIRLLILMGIQWIVLCCRVKCLQEVSDGQSHKCGTSHLTRKAEGLGVWLLQAAAYLTLAYSSALTCHGTWFPVQG